MNKKLAEIARCEIKKGLEQLSDVAQTIFKRMYSKEGLEVDINIVVDNMPEDKLDWALTQVENSLKKKREKEPD